MVPFFLLLPGLSPQGVLRRLDFIVIIRRSASLRSFNSLKSSGTSWKTVINYFSLVYPSLRPSEIRYILVVYLLLLYWTRDSKGKRHRVDFRWTSTTVEDRVRSSHENRVPSLRPLRNHSNSKMFDGSFFLFFRDSHPKGFSDGSIL